MTSSGSGDILERVTARKGLSLTSKANTLNDNCCSCDSLFHPKCLHTAKAMHALTISPTSAIATHGRRHRNTHAIIDSRPTGSSTNGLMKYNAKNIAIAHGCACIPCTRYNNHDSKEPK